MTLTPTRLHISKLNPRIGKCDIQKTLLLFLTLGHKSIIDVAHGNLIARQNLQNLILPKLGKVLRHRQYLFTLGAIKRDTINNGHRTFLFQEYQIQQASPRPKSKADLKFFSIFIGNNFRW